uniref:Uncharacterized protein n=1 Tax=Panagrolaimus sp. JU765 TaxID=591449 RepID=A0AC34PUL8_9BILA
MKLFYIVCFTAICFAFGITGNETTDSGSTAIEHGSSVTVSLNQRKKREETPATTASGGEDIANAKETEVTTMINPVEEAAEDVAKSHDENKGVEKREDEASPTKEEKVTAEENNDKNESSETVEAASNKEHVLRAKRVSKAGSSHKNRPSNVERISSNSNGNEANNEEAPHEYEFDTFHEYDH